MLTEIQAKSFWMAEAIKLTLIFKKIVCMDRNSKINMGSLMVEGERHVVVGNGERSCAKK